MLVARFWMLGASPPGFFSDEAAPAGTVLCFAETGESILGDKHPLFFETGLYPISPVFVYGATPWVRVFGGSIVSFRSFAALFGVLACFGAAAVAYQLYGRLAALFTLTVAACSPWAFQFSRIAWDPALAPAFVVMGFGLCTRKSNWAKVGGGLLLGLSAYVYPPLRLHAALIVVGVLFKLVRQKDRVGAGLVACSAAITVLPMALMLLSGRLMGRYAEVGILSASYRATVPHWYSLPLVAVSNYLQHLSPRFLFWSGDANLRHSTQYFGELGWLEILAVGCAVALFIEAKFRVSEGVALMIWCAATGFLPAALTWQGLPHALRSLSVWPFVAILSGCALAAFAEKRAWLTPVAAIVSIAFCVFFLRVYFVEYPVAAAEYFDADHQRFAENSRNSGDWTKYFEAGRQLPGLSFYYPMQYGGMNCRDVRAKLTTETQRAQRNTERKQ
jgi:4-amino-4-deoxy-L-arabinose transferase-like glycosyltransferase